jgi:hypothetical protein
VDVWEYFQQKEAECRDYSLAPETSFDRLCSEEEGSGGKRGRIFGHLILGENAYLSVHEVVVVREPGHIHREEYGYFLVIDGAEVWGFERDPTHDPAEHGHGAGHERVPAGRVTFKQVMDLAWKTLTEWEK